MLIAAPIMIGAASQPLPQLAARLDTRQWFEVAYLVLASGLGGTMLWNYGAKHLSSTAAGTFLYLIPVIAVAAGALVLGEQVTVYVVAGGLLMLAGVAAAQFGPALMAGAEPPWISAPSLALMFTMLVWGISPVFFRSLSRRPRARPTISPSAMRWSAPRSSAWPRHLRRLAHRPARTGRACSSSRSSA